MLFGAEQKTQPTSQKLRPDELSDDSNSIIPQQITMKIREICMNRKTNQMKSCDHFKLFSCLLLSTIEHSIDLKLVFICSILYLVWIKLFNPIRADIIFHDRSDLEVSTLK